MGAYGSPELDDYHVKIPSNTYFYKKRHFYKVDGRYLLRHFFKVFFITLAIGLLAFYIFCLGVGYGVSSTEKKYASLSSYSMQK